MTRHWVEAYVDRDQVSFRLICEDVATCEDTVEEDRGAYCAVMEWFSADGAYLLSFPDGRNDVFGRVEVDTKWTGYGEDAELELVPPGGVS